MFFEGFGHAIELQGFKSCEGVLGKHRFSFASSSNCRKSVGSVTIMRGWQRD